MCAPGCPCRACSVSYMSWHPAFKGRVDELIEEYKRMLHGASYFPIEVLAVQGANLEGQRD